jgi:hypothetical protein
MTALKEYQRLESIGLWRATDAVQRREVVVSFGDATLVLTDTAGRALTHWSLPAVERLNPGMMPALYSPDAAETETIEIEDDTMIGAIEKVRRSLQRQRPRSGRLRHVGIAFTLVVTLSLAVFWMPGALTRQTLTVVPPAKKSEIGATLLGHIQRLTGPTCRGVLGTQALARLKIRLLGRDTPGQIVVVPEGFQEAAYLPGGIIVLNRAMVEGSEDPAIVAGYVLSALAARSLADPLETILTEAGLRVTLRLITTGDIPPDTLRAHAEALVAGPQRDLPDALMLEWFEAAQVPATPYAQARATADRPLSALIDNDPMAQTSNPLILSDGDWISLQGICSG